MSTYFSFSHIHVRWDVMKLFLSRKELKDCSYEVRCNKVGIDRRNIKLNSDNVLTFGMPYPLPTGDYSFELLFATDEGMTDIVMSLPIYHAFEISTDPKKCANDKGQDVVVKLKQSDVANISVSPIIEPVIPAGDKFMMIDTDGDIFMSWGESKRITCRVYDKYMRDVSDEVSAWHIKRETRDPLSDQAWGYNQRAKSFRGVIDLYLGCYVEGESNTQYDLINDLAVDGGNTKFYITAKLPDIQIENIITI